MMPPMRTRSQHVVAGLKDKILRGDLAPGAKLPSEAELIEEYAVSRTVVREAVTRLQAEGLVETFQGRGSFVLAVPEPSSFTLETSAIRSHARRAGDGRLPDRRRERGGRAGGARVSCRRLGVDHRCARVVHRGRARGGRRGRLRLPPRRSRRATDNRFYVDLLDSLGPMMIMLPRTRLGDAYSMTDATHVERVQREHDNVAAAVLAGDVETARAAMRLHLGNTRRRVC